MGEENIITVNVPQLKRKFDLTKENTQLLISKGLSLGDTLNTQEYQLEGLKEGILNLGEKYNPQILKIKGGSNTSGTPMLSYINTTSKKIKLKVNGKRKVIRAPKYVDNTTSVIDVVLVEKAINKPTNESTNESTNE
jgi:ribosomal protein S6E (S10)